MLLFTSFLLVLVLSFRLGPFVRVRNVLWRRMKGFELLLPMERLIQLGLIASLPFLHFFLVLLLPCSHISFVHGSLFLTLLFF